MTATIPNISGHTAPDFSRLFGAKPKENVQNFRDLGVSVPAYVRFGGGHQKRHPR